MNRRKAGETKKKILVMLKNRQMTLSELAKELNMSPGSTHHHVKAMLKLRIIRIIPDWNAKKPNKWKYYEPN